MGAGPGSLLGFAGNLRRPTAWPPKRPEMIIIKTEVMIPRGAHDFCASTLRAFAAMFTGWPGGYAEGHLVGNTIGPCEDRTS